MNRQIDERPWISLRSVARIIGQSTTAAASLARSGKIRSRLLPGTARRTYARDDVIRIAEESAGIATHQVAAK